MEQPNDCKSPQILNARTLTTQHLSSLTPSRFLWIFHLLSLDDSTLLSSRIPVGFTLLPPMQFVVASLIVVALNINAGCDSSNRIGDL